MERKINIVIPAAGNGQRFKDAGYENPKYLIDVCGKPMIERVKDNLKPNKDHVFKVITPHDLKYPSRGAVETIIQAEIDPDAPLLIANCDQLVAFDVNEFINTSLDGMLVVFKSDKPHHSYVETDSMGVITRIVEKEVISNIAVTGVYYFKKASDFIAAAELVIKNDTRVKGEYYVSSALDIMIRNGIKLGVYEAPSAMLGTPSELQLFEAAVAVAKDVL